MTVKYTPLSTDDAVSILGEGLHTGLRKGTDAADADFLWKAISDSNTSAWSDALRFLVRGLDQMDMALVTVTPEPSKIVTNAQYNQAIETVIDLIMGHLNAHPETTPDQSFAMGVLSSALYEMREDD